MLSFSESSAFAASASLTEALQAEISDENYETSVAGLLERSYEHEVAIDSNAIGVYREADKF